MYYHLFSFLRRLCSSKYHLIWTDAAKSVYQTVTPQPLFFYLLLPVTPQQLQYTHIYEDCSFQNNLFTLLSFPPRIHTKCNPMTLRYVALNKLLLCLRLFSAGIWPHAASPKRTRLLFLGGFTHSTATQGVFSLWGGFVVVLLEFFLVPCPFHIYFLEHLVSHSRTDNLDKWHHSQENPSHSCSLPLQQKHPSS